MKDVGLRVRLQWRHKKPLSSSSLSAQHSIIITSTMNRTSSSKFFIKTKRKFHLKMMGPSIMIVLLTMALLALNAPVQATPQTAPIITATATSTSNSEINLSSTDTVVRKPKKDIPEYFVQLQALVKSSSTTMQNNPIRYYNQSSISDLISSTAAAAATAVNSKSGDIEIDHHIRAAYGKTCMGTNTTMNSSQSDKWQHYHDLVARYRYCTHVNGNLEIAWLDDRNHTEPLDMSFLENIQEITGYLLISQVHVTKISMPNLRIIRGTQKKDEFAMLIRHNEIRSLELPNLGEILDGSVGFIDNENLCHFTTIKWDEILNWPNRMVVEYNQVAQPDCPPCDPSCMGNCWSPRPDMCQKFSKTNCAPHCNQARCFGPAPRDCCHPFCAGGCTGPEPTQCLSCKYFSNDGECIKECPPMQIYNPSKFILESNPRGKYAFGNQCVKECPDYLLRDNGACVRTCPSEKRSSNGECLDNDADHKNQGNTDSNNRRQPANCTQIEAGSDCNQVSPQGTVKYVESANSKSSHAVSSSSEPMSMSTSSSTASTTNGSSVQDSKRDPLASCKPLINSTIQPGPDLDSSGLTATPLKCIKPDEPCPEGYFQEYLGQTSSPVCKQCHHRCQRCTGMGTHVSVCECAAYVAGEQCEDSCPRDYFPHADTRRCMRCSPECNGCSGPTAADCHTCRVYRVYLSGSSPIVDNASASIESNSISDLTAGDSAQAARQQQPPFNCTSQCPPDKPYRISESNLPDLYCSETPDINGDAALLAARNPNQILVGLGTWLMLFSVVFSGIAICFWVHRMESEKDKTVKLTMHLSGIDDVEPLNPSNMKPNLAPLRSIKETELRKGNELGSGFGGTVYQGLWHPEGREHKNPRPVAIKVLRDNGQSNMNKKFLDEAYIMASVNHPNLVKLLAVCMTPKHLMLVTPLMPLGCLLEHVKKHKHDISSKNLLEWSKQIAKGMAYLEEHRMVHRDLALRNVLLRICGRAMISDFGLAKFLEIDQSEYHSLGGRLPVKWLAPECIRERRFTHKSDVWAFGVTVWELLTFGRRPFEEYNTWKDMLTAVENGARLEQPPYLTTEVYSLMLSCWFYRPEARPSFRQLTQDFVKFARDPLRYVAIGSKGLDYDPSLGSPMDSPPGKFARLAPPTKSSHQHQQRHHTATDLDSEHDDEYSADSDLEQSQLSSSLAGDEQDPQQLLATSELTPSTHNRINETIRFGFDFRRHHHHHAHQHHHQRQQQQHSSMSECSSDTNPLKTPTTPLKRMHFADQQLIEETDYDDADMFKAASKKQQQLDSNNNFITVPSAETWQRLGAGSLSRSHKLSTAAEQPRDMYDYLLPSPCTEAATHNFSQLYATTAQDHVFDEVDAGDDDDEDQAASNGNNSTSSSSCNNNNGSNKAQTPPGGAATNRSSSLSSSHQLAAPANGQQQAGARCATLPHSQLHHQHQHHLSTSRVGVNNYEYFVTRASSQYLSNQQQQQHYADMDPAAAAAAVVAAARQLQQSQQHLSTSDENIPHSLV